jgi:hypothetical protein
MTTWLGRRQFVAGSVSCAALATHTADAEARHATRRQVLSFGMQSSGSVAFALEQLTTYLLTIPLEAQVESLRVGLANITPTPYRLNGICCCEGTIWDSAPGANWGYFTFTEAGIDPREPAQTPQPCEVPGNHPVQTGAINVPAIYWSDWMRYRTNAASGRPQMLLRVLAPPQWLSLAPVGAHGNLADIIPGLRSWTLSVMQTPGDFVTDPAQPRDAVLAPGTPVMVVQYRSAVPGIEIVIGGDSHLSMFHTFARQAGIVLSTPSVPISTWDAAWGGQTSRTTWPCLDQAVDLARPSVCVIQGWTLPGEVGRVAYEQRVRESADRVLRQGGIPVIVKALPRHLFGHPALQAEWEQANRDLDQLVPGAVLFDGNAYVGDPIRPADWRSDASTDGIHPNVAGNVLLREPFVAMLRTLL